MNANKVFKFGLQLKQMITRRGIFFVLAIVLAFSFSKPTICLAETSYRGKVATIMFSGIGGAILGLSTLSFYGQPSEHVSNISTGFALGIIIGTGYVSYQAAVEGSYADRFPYQESAFDLAQNPRRQQRPRPAPLQWAFSF